ncbi:hypothetical protein G6F50_018283 [Rhizopus delemar]|uniref:Uncharacterized protein n=1 Tax=Rhizopus delemar TaxID=936053 RepID=A0A9P7BYL0_9FUNG|nr:hypothetical protein G6F50_018283 [Rhizopus delemar]
MPSRLAASTVPGAWPWASSSATAPWMRTRSPASVASAIGHGLNARTVRASAPAACAQSSFASALSSLCA